MWFEVCDVREIWTGAILPRINIEKCAYEPDYNDNDDGWKSVAVDRRAYM